MFLILFKTNHDKSDNTDEEINVVQVLLLKPQHSNMSLQS